MCGYAKYPGHLKKDGSVMWHCTFKFPFNYYALKDSDGKIKKTVFEDERDSLLSLQKEGDFIEELKYEGCPRHQPDAIPSSDPFDL